MEKEIYETIRYYRHEILRNSDNLTDECERVVGIQNLEIDSSLLLFIKFQRTRIEIIQELILDFKNYLGGLKIWVSIFFA